MQTTFQASPIRLDNVLPVLVIAATLAFAGYAAIASVVAPLVA